MIANDQAEQAKTAQGAARVAVLYATREGQTARIAEHVAAELRVKGLQADVHHIERAEDAFDLGAYRGAVLAASVHLGKHEREMVGFVKRHKAELDRLATAFLSVSLTEAGVERAETPPELRAQATADVKRLLDEFYEQTGWHPMQAKSVAGALLYTRYNVLVRFVMKQISKREGGDTDTSRDYEYTDWQALDRFVDQLADGIAGRQAIAASA